MQCRSCNSTNINAQVTTETNFKQGRGCYHPLPCFMGHEVDFKANYLCLLQHPVGLVMGIIAVINKREYRSPDWLRSIMQRRGRAYSIQNTMMVCQDCGYTTRV